MIRRNLLVITLVIISSICAAQNKESKDSILLRKEKFESAKLEFLDYEQKHGHFFQTKNVNLHYLEWGDPTNTPILWLHGSFSSAYELKRILKDLLENQYYVLAIDYYGHGQTKIPAHEVSLYHIADDLNELMQAKKIEKAIIGGWSRGGIIATAFYDTYPNKVLGLILEDGGSVSTNTHYHQMSAQQLGNRIDEIFEDRFNIPKFKSELEAFYFLFDENSEASQFELCTWLVQDSLGDWTIGNGLEALFHMASKKQFLETILRPTKATLFGESMSIIEPKIIYRNLNVPLLILDPISEEDLFPYEQENQLLFEAHPTLITYKKFYNTGHNIHYERPKEFIKELIDFRKVVLDFWSK